MFFYFSFKSAILFVFFFHGMVYSVLLLIKGLQKANKSSIWLSLAVGLSTLYLFPFMCGYGGWYSQNPYRDILFYLPFQQLFLLPPVLYFYVKSLLDKSFVFTRKHGLHFVPAAAYLLYSLVVFVTDKWILQDSYFYRDGRDKDFSPWYQVVGFISMLCYLVLSLKVYGQYKKITYQVLSFADMLLFSWVKRFLFSFLVLLLLRALFFVLNPEWGQFGSKFWYYLCFSILIYYISISGYANSLQSIIPFNTTAVFGQTIPKSTYVQEHLPAGVKAPGGSLDRKAFDRLKEQIEQAMVTGKLFTNPELTLSHLAEKLDVNSKKVSQVINQGFNMNFNDFVNHYRTKEVLEILQSNDSQSLTLLGVALDCGFNSKSTFNRAFKKETSMSPKAYLEKYQQK